mmetsp:Transcript_24573/g.51462  ORF Transcript_24573/g.51462 Transcript_24573/m.51462 type:complete len:162 (-) Transcript_24573:37-522(-)
MCADVFEGLATDGDGHCFLLMCSNISVHPCPFGVVTCGLDPFFPHGDNTNHCLRNKIMCWAEDVFGGTLPPTLLFRPEWFITGSPIPKIDADAFNDATVFTMNVDTPIDILHSAASDSAISDRHASAKQKRQRTQQKLSPHLTKKLPPGSRSHSRSTSWSH